MDGTRARAVLSVTEHASTHELRRAFRARCLATHPDRGGNAREFAETLAAFQTLEPLAPIVRPHAPVDVYDSPVASATRTRPFADVLQAAMAQVPIAA